MWSKDRLDDWAVVKQVFMILICLSMKPFDLGYKGSGGDMVNGMG